MAQAAEQLVGRPTELDAFDQILVELERGRPAAVALVGEPGIGKSRLLAELANRADARGHLVLSGCASELERDLPFWVFVDALDEYAEGLDPDRLEQLDDNAHAELSHVLPALSALDSGGVAVLQDERYRTHRAVRDLLEMLAAAKPLVLILDDLHWADSGSIELLGALLRRLPSAPVLLAMAARPRQVPDRLSVALERAHRSGRLTRHELGALTLPETQQLLGPEFDGAATNALYQESGGNPFYVEQLARTLTKIPGAIPTVADASSASGDVPRAVIAALNEELGLLSPGARLVLEGAAVAGDPFEPELAAAAAAVTESSAVSALDELLRSDLVRQTDVPRRFRFRHPLVRRAVYDTSPGGWRLGAHQRSAEALAVRGAPAAARAHHVELSAREGDASAVATLREAGEATARRTPASAARWFGGALRLLSSTAPAEERIELLLARSRALASTGRFAESYATLVESMSILPVDAGRLRVRITLASAGVEHLLGRHKNAHARLESALAELPDRNSPEAVELTIELAVDSLYAMNYDAMREWAVRACDAALPVGDRTLTAAALAVSAAAGALLGAIADAQVQRERAAEVIDALSDEEIARRLDALVHLAMAELYLDQFRASVRHAERALKLGRATGQGDLFPLIFPILGTALWPQGRVAEAGEALEGAVEAARLLGNTQGLAWNLFNRSDAALAAGDVDLALACAEESVDLSRSLDESVVSVAATAALAGALLESGRAERAAELLLASAGGEDLQLIPGSWRARILELLTRCLLQSGRLAEAERAADATAACADAFALPMPTAMAALASAEVALAHGDAARAAELALTAVTLLEEVEDVFDAAAARVLAGRALGQTGDRDRAIRELERAAEAFGSFGSLRYRAEAERELRKLGHATDRRSRPGKADERGMAALSDRELEVARLVVDRKTNPEIAAALFLSQKTVETHLRNIFRKLGVTSRVELARAVERADRTA
jgi:ATP/maltotriose-dependent transcriptional regulator MalT